MAFEELKEQIAQAEQHLRQYGESSASYYRLKAFRLAMRGLLFLYKGFLLGLLALLFFVFLSLAGAFAIGNALSSIPLGFLIVAGIYFLAFLLAYALRDRINRPLLRKFSEYFFDDA